jgi:RNA polymerase sigma-70 factor, ECF subfamily
VFSLSLTFVDGAIPNTRSLLERAQAGDLEAFGEVCRNHEKRLFRQALTLCGNTVLAEDLAQDTLVEAWKFLRRYNGRCEFYTWLCAILLNRYRNTMRERRPIPFSAFADDDREVQSRVEQSQNAEPSPDQAALLREEAALVRQCIDALPLKHQQVILLRFYVDDSLEGIAAALGCSVGTVKSRLFHALEKLRGMQAMSRPLGRIQSKADAL